MEPDTPALQLLDPAKVRDEMEVTIDIGDGKCVIAKRLDMTAMIFEGLVPLPLLEAVQKMAKLRGETTIERLMAVDDENKQALLSLLRRHAVAAVVRPKLVEKEDGVREHLPVELLTLPQLMAIWTATMIVPSVAPAAAARFRVPPRADAAPVLPVGEDVRPSPEPMAVVDDREVIHQ